METEPADCQDALLPIRPFTGNTMKTDPDHFARTLVAGMPDAIVYADAAGLIRPVCYL